MSAKECATRCLAGDGLHTDRFTQKKAFCQYCNGESCWPVTQVPRCLAPNAMSEAECAAVRGQWVQHEHRCQYVGCMWLACGAALPLTLNTGTLASPRSRSVWRGNTLLARTPSLAHLRSALRLAKYGSSPADTRCVKASATTKADRGTPACVMAVRYIRPPSSGGQSSKCTMSYRTRAASGAGASAMKARTAVCTTWAERGLGVDYSTKASTLHKKAASAACVVGMSSATISGGWKRETPQRP